MVKVISTTAVGEEESSPEARSGASSVGNPEEQRADVELDHLEGADDEKEEITVYLLEGPREDQAGLVRELHQRMEELTELYRAHRAALEVTEEELRRIQETVRQMSVRQDLSHQAAKNKSKVYFTVGFLMGCVTFALMKWK